MKAEMNGGYHLTATWNVGPRPAGTPEIEFEQERIDFNSPEDVLVEIVANVEDVPSWRDYSIETATVINGKDGIMGAASYEHSYGAGLDYIVEDLIDCPGAGWWVIEGVTGVYTRGDGYSTDDDMSFSCKGFRPATAEERAMA